MAEQNKINSYDIGNEIIDTLVKNKAVKVDRRDFLFSLFKDNEHHSEIQLNGPIGKVDEKIIQAIGKKLINETTMKSTSLSFAAGLPGGLYMAATIPADILQFYGMSAILAQKLMYLYGYPDMYNDEKLTEDGRKSLILFLGAMLGVSGAASAVKGLSVQLAAQTAKKLPNKALTQTFYYPIIKKIITFMGGKVTKDSFAKGISKAIPVLGGIISGGLTFATLRPMGLRLQDTLHSDNFVIVTQETIVDPVNKLSSADKLKEAKELFDLGILDEEEFLTIKNNYLSQL